MFEHRFTTYVRTKLLFQQRFKDLPSYDKVRIHIYELKKFGLDYEENFHKLLNLERGGEIGFKDGWFWNKKMGNVDPLILDETRKWPKIRQNLTPLHEYMQGVLMKISIDSADLPVYFKAFLEHRKKSLHMFFTVDGFSGRVHTPVVNLKGDLRFELKIDGENIISLDVKQMQPTILASILKSNVGSNPFTSAVEEGKDVYEVLMKENRMLRSRGDAKKFFYKLIFGKPTEEICDVFHGNREWIYWINHYKTVYEPRNPHGRQTHTNLAWLLQTNEVRIMSKIWEALRVNNILFLTIHDDILCKTSDANFVENTMREVLAEEFVYFEIVSKSL